MDHGPLSYAYALGQHYPSANEMTYIWGGRQTNSRPANVDYAGHSISQLWLIDGDVKGGDFSTVEFGWKVAPPIGGVPRLFTFTFDGGEGTCYNGCWGNQGHFIQFSKKVYPGMPLPADAELHSYQIQWGDHAWWVIYDGEPVGFYPPTSYERRKLVRPTRLDAGGEIATDKPGSCVEMGTGYLPDGPYAGQSARWEDIQRWSTSTGYKNVNTAVGLKVTDPWYYRAKYLPQKTNGFRYGGSGACNSDNRILAGEQGG